MKNTLEQNLELRKALAEVDRLTSENVELKEKYKNISNQNERNKFCSVIDRGLIDRLKKEFQSYLPKKCNYIIVENPYLVFSILTHLFFEN